MTITIGNFSLADGGDASPGDLRINGKHSVQTAEFLRVSNATPFARGNKVNTITFWCVRDHASYADAQSFLISHNATMPDSGTLTITTEPFEGGITQFTVASAAVESDDGVQMGIATKHTYTVICGALTGGNIAQQSGGGSSPVTRPIPL
jgi:hypothetical protein